VQNQDILHVTATPRHVIGIAASAGGVEALREVVAGLPAELSAAICVVLHIPPTGRSLLAPILDRATDLDVIVAEDGLPLRAGTVYIAPADHHLLVHSDHVELSRGPKENGVRPAADPMFRSLARSWGADAVAVVLSGALDDGAAGAFAIDQSGGRVIIQDPDDALVPGMPESALAVTAAPQVASAGAIAELLSRLATSAGPRPDGIAPRPEAPETDFEPERPDGPASGFTCPECSGPLWELRVDALTRYRCRVGHAYSEEAMVAAQGTAVEAALWAALEALEERSELLLRLAGRVEGLRRTHERFTEGAREASERAATLRRILHHGAEAATG
jgi:two-component system chemotaxis response regulator CheB